MKTFFSAIALLISSALFAQQGKDVKSDSAAFLKEAAERSCKCIDSISLNNKSQDEISKEISSCIEKDAGAYELILKLSAANEKSKEGKEKNINIQYDPTPEKHNRYYFDIERYLTKNCPSLATAAASNNKESAFSISNNPDALKYFIKGQDEEKKENYTGAAVYFQTAVSIDSMFTFAWDNLGICLRKLKNYPDAVKAYKRSLAIDPKGMTPLQNLPVVYQLQNDFDNALASYQNLIRLYPGNAEGYFGTGQLYLSGKQDNEKGLDYMCKAYNLYIKQGSVYRTDAEKTISYIYSEMKKTGKEDVFYKILSDNNITPSKN